MTAGTAPLQRTILVVDDQRDIVTLVRTALELKEYRVLTAVSGASARETFSEHREEIDAVILDISLPDMSGGDLMQELFAINDRVPVILTSGYDRHRVEDLLEAGAAGFLPKPFDFSALCEKLDEILAPAPA